MGKAAEDRRRRTKQKYETRVAALMEKPKTGDVLTPLVEKNQIQALVALLEAPSIGEAAELAGVPRRTLYYWRNKDENFRAALMYFNKAAVEHAVLRLNEISQRAADATDELLTCSDPKIRIQAINAFAKLWAALVSDHEIKTLVATQGESIEEIKTRVEQMTPAEVQAALKAKMLGGD